METDLNNMTMRDIFAAFALAGSMANQDGLAFTEREKTDITDTMYEWADAMINSRRFEDATGL
jgi:hypothetical protein